MPDIFLYGPAENPNDVILRDPATFQAKDIVFSASPNISAGAIDATTAQLTAPTGKTSGADFQTGYAADDNSLAAMTLGNGKYTEIEVSLKAISGAQLTDYYFRIVIEGRPIDVYTIYPQLTVTAGGAGPVIPIFLHQLKQQGIA